MRRLLALPPPRRGWRGTVEVAASALRVAAIADFEDDEGTPRSRTVYSGPPGGPLVPEAPRPGWLPVQADVDGDRVLLAEGRVRSPSLRWRLRLLFPAEPVAAPARALPPVALAGDRVAYSELGRREHAVRVADRRTGAVAAEIGLRRFEDLNGDGIDLAPDGRVVAAVDGRLLTAAPGAPRAAVPGGAGLGAPRFAGHRIGALQDLPSRFANRARRAAGGGERPAPARAPGTRARHVRGRPGGRLPRHGPAAHDRRRRHRLRSLPRRARRFGGVRSDDDAPWPAADPAAAAPWCSSPPPA